MKWCAFLCFASSLCHLASLEGLDILIMMNPHEQGLFLLELCDVYVIYKENIMLCSYFCMFCILLNLNLTKDEVFSSYEICLNVPPTDCIATLVCSTCILCTGILLKSIVNVKHIPRPAPVVFSLALLVKFLASLACALHCFLTIIMFIHVLSHDVMHCVRVFDWSYDFCSCVLSILPRGATCGQALVCGRHVCFVYMTGIDVFKDSQYSCK